jgi:hypothetical protein
MCILLQGLHPLTEAVVTKIVPCYRGCILLQSLHLLQRLHSVTKISPCFRGCLLQMLHLGTQASLCHRRSLLKQNLHSVIEASVCYIGCTLFQRLHPECPRRGGPWPCCGPGIPGQGLQHRDQGDELWAA